MMLFDLLNKVLGFGTKAWHGHAAKNLEQQKYEKNLNWMVVIVLFKSLEQTIEDYKNRLARQLKIKVKIASSVWITTRLSFCFFLT